MQPVITVTAEVSVREEVERIAADAARARTLKEAGQELNCQVDDISGSEDVRTVYVSGPAATLLRSLHGLRLRQRLRPYTAVFDAGLQKPPYNDEAVLERERKEYARYYAEGPAGERVVTAIALDRG